MKKIITVNIDESKERATVEIRTNGKCNKLNNRQLNNVTMVSLASLIGEMIQLDSGGDIVKAMQQVKNIDYVIAETAADTSREKKEIKIEREII